MDGTITATRVCGFPFEAVTQLFKEDSQAPRSPAFGAAMPIKVNLHPRRPWRAHDETITPRPGRLESVGNGQARLNLTWQGAPHGFFPTVDGHLEINRMSAEQCELRYVGGYHTKGLHGVAGGHKLVEEAIGQLLDATVETVQQSLTSPL